MIPHKDLEQLIQYYKGELAENALLNKAATLAAKKHVLLANPQLPPALVNAQTKPLSQELTKLTKRIRNFLAGWGLVHRVARQAKKAKKARKKPGIW